MLSFAVLLTHPYSSQRADTAWTAVLWTPKHPAKSSLTWMHFSESFSPVISRSLFLCLLSASRHSHSHADTNTQSDLTASPVHTDWMTYIQVKVNCAGLYYGLCAIITKDDKHYLSQSIDSAGPVQMKNWPTDQKVWVTSMYLQTATIGLLS